MDHPFTEEELALGELSIKGVARRRGIPEAEVRVHMEAAVRAMRYSPDPRIRAVWEEIPRAGEEVTVEEYVAYFARLMREHHP